MTSLAHLPFHVVDVFTDTAYAGNPLAVVLDTDDLGDEALQAIAREFNLSETAFPQRPTRDGADYRVRIFTPVTELPFAGHPSVGTAWLLGRLGRLAPGERVQQCAAGLLPVSVPADGGPVRLSGGSPTVGAAPDAHALLAAVGLGESDLAAPAPRSAGAGLEFAYLAVRDEAVRRAVPSTPLIAAAGVTNGIVVAAWRGDAATAHVRAFAGGVGVGEDPATGSAALGLGVWLVASGVLPDTGESAYTVHQGLEIGRPSLLSCTVTARDGRAVSCTVAGHVVPISEGSIRRP